MSFKPIEYILESHYKDGEWSDLRLIENQINARSGFSALHYSQSIFEGMRIEKKDGQLHYFRLSDHLNRLNFSSSRFCIPNQNIEKLKKQILELSHFLYHYDLDSYDYIYVRPLVFGCDDSLVIKPSQEYKLQISFCLLKTITQPRKARTELEFIKSNCGNVKFSGNYASAMLSDQKSRTQGFDTTLWLRDGLIEEFSSMNILCFNGTEWLTPKMTKNILDGITKRTFSSIFQVIEKELTLNDLKSMKIVLGSGTAAGVLPISKIDNLLFDTSEAFLICQEYKKQTFKNPSFFDEIKKDEHI